MRTKASKAAEIAINLSKDKLVDKVDSKMTPQKETTQMKPQVQAPLET